MCMLPGHAHTITLPWPHYGPHIQVRPGLSVTDNSSRIPIPHSPPTFPAHIPPRIPLQVRPSFSQKKTLSRPKGKTLSPTWEGERLQLPVPASRAWAVSHAALPTDAPPCRPLAASY